MKNMVLAVLLLSCVCYSGVDYAGISRESYQKQTTWQETMLMWHRNMEMQLGDDYPLRDVTDFGAEDITVCAWIRTTKGGTIICKAPALGNWAPQGKSIFVRDGRLCYDIGWVGVIISDSLVGDGKWHHIAVTHAGDDIRFYVDGVKDKSGRLESQPDPAGFAMKVGYTSANFPTQSYYDGLIDELAIYDMALSDAEIRIIYSNKEVARRGLVGYWSFDDGVEMTTGNFEPAGDVEVNFANGVKGKAVEFKVTSGLVYLPGGAGKLEDDVWKKLAGDFPGERNAQEMKWEREDGVWKAISKADQSELIESYNSFSEECLSSSGYSRLFSIDTNSEKLSTARDNYYKCKRLQMLQNMLGGIDMVDLRDMLEESNADKNHVGQFSVILKQAQAWIYGGADDSAPDQIAIDVKGLYRAVMLDGNELIDFDKIIFVKRYTYQSSHYYTDFIDGCEKFGGSICVLDLDTGKVKDIVPSLKDGVFGRMDLSFDGRKVVFAYKAKQGVGFRIYEVNVDGTGLRQLTFEPADEQQRIDRYWIRDLKSWAGRPTKYRHHTDDMDPCYLPDGGICFISTRCRYGILCDGPDYFTTTVLYRMDGDGGNIEKLTNSSVSEASPTVMNDGRVLYTRWEYVDKGAVSVKCLWAIRPDGTGQAEIYGNDVAVPTTFLHARAIPGSNDLFVSLNTPHCCPTNGIGAVVRINTTMDIRAAEHTSYDKLPDPVTELTPYIRIPDNGHNGFLHLREGRWVPDKAGPLFMDPYPLSEGLFLVSQNLDEEWKEFNAWDLYLLDANGSTILIHDDPEISCYQPMPLRARTRPPVLETSRDQMLADNNLARVIVTDIYKGLENVERGSIKYIRINEQVPRPWGARRNWGGDVYDQQHACITKDTHLGLKVQHGIVPVEDDGSAHFTVPADRNIFFQVLDKDYMEVQRERTYVNYRPGETRACIGCHERTNVVAANYSKVPLALKRAASEPGPQPGEKSGRRVIHYMTDVQPTFDMHCIRCHSGEKAKAGLDLSGTETNLFCVSYENILRKGLIPVVGENHPKWGNVHYVPPYTLGSHASRLVQQLLRGKGHKGIGISFPEMVRLTTWVDSNGQYYGSYYGRRNKRYKDHPNYRPVPTFDQAVSTEPVLEEEKR